MTAAGGGGFSTRSRAGRGRRAQALPLSLSRWVDAVVYSDAWFGSVDNGAAEGHRPQGGKLADARTVYDPAPRAYPDADHNAYGVLSAKNDADGARALQRSARVCGFALTQPPAPCSKLVGCFANETAETFSLSAFDHCLEGDVHANLHGMNAGMWDCAVDAAAHAAAIPGASDALVSFVLVTVTDIVVKSADYFPYYECPARCELNVTSFSACRCVANLSKPIDLMSDAEVYAHVEKALEFLLSNAYESARFMERLDGAPMPLRFRGVSDADVGAPLRRLYLRVLAAPGQFGSMGSNAAANDPLFWVIHPLFDKAWHVLRLAPAYARWNMTWDNHVKASTCDGVGWHSATPFDGLFDGGPNGSYTNAQIWELFDPLGSHLPYVYDQYTSWGDCTWDAWDA